MKCMIVDDEEHAIEVLKSHISKLKELQLVFATTNPLEAFSYLQSREVDLIFLDIEMPELNGLEFLKLLNGKFKVILTTAYSEFAIEAFEHHVLDYLLKPVLFPRFLKAISRITDTPKSEIGPKQEEYIFVKTGIRNKVIKVDFHKIIYVESMGNYVHFNMTDEKISCLMPLKEVEQLLPKDMFMRIHQSYIVPLNQIRGREGNQLLITNKQLPIGETYKKAVSEFFNIQKNFD